LGTPIGIIVISLRLVVAYDEETNDTDLDWGVTIAAERDGTKDGTVLLLCHGKEQ
jgi:hypothetical protein